MRKKIIVGIFFNVDPGWANNPYKEARLTREWIEYRMNIFMTYTCRSLKEQTNQNFTALIAYDPQTEGIIRDVLSHYNPLPENIIFTTNLYRDTLIHSRGYDQIYHVRIDSDNMFHPTYIQQLQAINPREETRAIICQKGYTYDVPSKALCSFYHESPSFYALIYTFEEYRSAKKFNTPRGHLDVINLPHEILDHPNFVIVIHKQNISNRFNSSLCHGRIEEPMERQRILGAFHIDA